MRSTADSPPASGSSSSSDIPAPRIRQLGRADYAVTMNAMQRFTAERCADTPDEIWLLEHSPVFTLGLNAAREHLLAPGDIPVIQADRGGQVTYHGPGQLVAYTLIDIRRARLNVRQLVTALESAVIDLLANYDIDAVARRDAPGVYAAGAKIASLGLRIRKGASYHGLALNVAMDLAPYSRINPCGFEALPVTQLADLGGPRDLDEVAGALGPRLIPRLRA
ncbi:MAG: lipoyl(octanoyl) transferase LipB [Chromatiales bacterium]|nr:MAG: lipoyl(octanoyl) transferase LipB [Chromatiales bacterium]